MVTTSPPQLLPTCLDLAGNLPPLVPAAFSEVRINEIVYERTRPSGWHRVEVKEYVFYDSQERQHYVGGKPA